MFWDLFLILEPDQYKKITSKRSQKEGKQLPQRIQWDWIKTTEVKLRNIETQETDDKEWEKKISKKIEIEEYERRSYVVVSSHQNINDAVW